MEKETNLEHYLPEVKRAVQEAYGRPTQIFDTIRKSIDPEIERNNPDCISDILAWMVQQYREPILDSTEKRYLSGVIRPFRKNSIEILKLKNICDQDYIQIRVGLESFDLPSFEEETMYKGMKYYRSYRPEDLGL